MDYGRIPPQSIESEKYVLGCMMIDSETIEDVLEVINESDFYRQDNKTIFEVIKSLNLINKPVEVISAMDKLKELNLLDKCGGLEYLVSLTDVVVSTTNAKYYASIVKEKSILRKFIKSSTDILNACYEGKEDIDTITQMAESQILSVNETQKTDMTHVSRVLEDTLRKIEERSKNKGQLEGITTGFADLDYKLKGMKKGDLVLIAARPSMGKTSLAENIADYVGIIKQIPVAFFSLEMSKEKLMNRTLSSMAMVDNSKIQLGTLDDGDYHAMSGLYGMIGEGKIEYDDTIHMKATDIRSKCRRMKKKYGELGLIIVDHLTEMWRPMKGNDVAEYTENVRAMKRLAKEMDCPLILLQQLNRGVEGRNDKRPILSDLKETGASEEVADIVMMIYRDDYYNPDSEKKNIAEILVRKGRDIGTGIVELVWLPQYTKFASLEKFRQENPPPPKKEYVQTGFSRTSKNPKPYND